MSLGRRLLAAATREKAGSLGICAVGFDDGARQQIVGSVLAAALAAAFRLPAYKADAEADRVRSIRLLGLDERIDTSRTKSLLFSKHSYTLGQYFRP